jgi:hypothetical protein
MISMVGWRNRPHQLDPRGWHGYFLTTDERVCCAICPVPSAGLAEASSAGTPTCVEAFRDMLRGRRGARLTALTLGRRQPDAHKAVAV